MGEGGVKWGEEECSDQEERRGVEHLCLELPGAWSSVSEWVVHGTHPSTMSSCHVQRG